MSENGSSEQLKLQKVIDNVNKVIYGKRNVIKLSVAALLTKGHVLFEDVPGVGKTMLIRSLAQSISCDFSRIQFTPDLLPSDVTGVSIYNPKDLNFEFIAGPVFGNIVLADEINRTSPKTQSSLLEAMEEGSVTVDGVTRTLDHPFFVMATQNPIDYDGTYALPEAQLDRFLLKLRIGYPSYDNELDMLKRNNNHSPIESIYPVMTKSELLKAQDEVNSIYVDDKIHQYILNIVTRTRKYKDILLGVSPRGALALMKVCKSYAYLEGRTYVVPDDVKYLAPFVISHRIQLTADARYQGKSTDTVIEAVIQSVRVPIDQRTRQ